jgi:hypothetical protein
MTPTRPARLDLDLRGAPPIFQRLSRMTCIQDIAW